MIPFFISIYSAWMMVPIAGITRRYNITCAVCMNARLYDNLTSMSACSSPFDPEGESGPYGKDGK